MINNADFGKRLAKVIEYYGESGSSFAEKIGVQRSSISHILSGRNKPSLEFVLKVLAGFPEVELYWLINGKGQFPKIDQNITTEKQHTLPTQNFKPDLFNEPEKPILEKTPISETIQKSDSIQNIVKTVSKGKSIERIVIFYSDGSFSDYENH